MSRINQKFEELRSKNQKGLITYIMAGYPSEKDTLSIVRGLIKGGADIIELGFPFSDPLADGPIIQNASMIALEKGIKIKKFFSMVKKIRNETDIPLVIMTYANILYHYGYQRFISEAKKVGIDGFILPDMSIEESDEYVKIAKKYDMDTIFLISPNTSNQRVKDIAKATSGFLYLVAVYGTTGVKTDIKNYTIKALKNTKKITKIPVGIGFGVSTPDDVRKYVSIGADAVIVGSALLKLIENTKSKDLEGKIDEFTKKLKRSTIN